MEVKTGAIKAIVNLDRTEDGHLKENYNYAIARSYEPGEVVSAMTQEAVLPDTLDFDIVGLREAKVDNDGAWTLTPLHVLSFYNTLANGGKMMKPYLVERLEPSDGATKGVVEYGPKVLKENVLRPSDSSRKRAGLCRHLRRLLPGRCSSVQRCLCRFYKSHGKTINDTIYYAPKRNLQRPATFTAEPFYSNEPLYKLRHVHGEEPQVIVLPQILRVQKILGADLPGELFAEVIHGRVRLVTGGFHFNGAEFVASGEKEVDFVIVLATGSGPGVIIEFVALGTEYLGNHILIDVAQVRREFVAQQFLVDDVLRDGIVPESHRDKQSGISDKHLVLLHILVLGYADRGIVGMIGEADGHAVFHVLNKLVHIGLILAATEYAGHLISGCIAGQLGRSGHKHACGPACGVNLTEVVSIKVDDLPLDRIHDTEVLCVKIGVHGLRHAAHQHVQPEIAEKFAARGIPDAFLFIESLFHKGNGRRVPERPSEFLIVHGKHVDAGLFAGDDDALRVLFNGEQGSGFDEIITVVLYKVFDGFTHLRGLLYLIEDDDGLPGHQSHIIDELKPEEELVVV